MKRFFRATFFIILDALSYFIVLAGVLLLVFGVVIIVRKQIWQGIGIIGGGIVAIGLALLLKKLVAKEYRSSFLGQFLDDILLSLLPPW